ncbi:MAG: PAS domain S-box protein [Arhodomonas sp.]|nr:PAS domain S-box protein [Arhodomonas sp.]
MDLADPAIREQPLEAVMSHPVAFLPAEATVAEARARLESSGIRHLLVRGSDGATQGILSQTDLAGTAGVEARLRLHTVHTALAPDLLRLPADKPLSQAARRMSSRGQTAAVVDFADGEPGIVTERDVVRILADESGDPDLATVASRPLVTVAADDSLLAARERMLAHGIRRLAVTDADGRVTGLVGLADLLATSEASLVQQLEAALADTRARLQAEEEARQRREREVAEVYDEMFHRNTAPKLLIDPETGAIADANPAALAFYGYSDEQIRQQRIQDINLLSEAEVQAEREKARHEERRYFEFRHCLANGEIRDVKVYSGPVVIDGRTYLHSIIHDVTEARRYREHLERYKAIFETLPVGVYRNRPDTDGPFEEVNPAMARIFGAESVAELLQHTTAELYRDPEQRQRFSEELLTRGEVRRHELDLQTLDGRPIQGAVSARVRYEEDGRPVFDGVVEDVTDRKALEQSLLKYRAAFEQSPDAVMFLDRDRFLEGNPTTLAMFRADSEEAFRGCHPAELSPPVQPDGRPSAEAARDRIEEAFEQGQAFFEWQHRTLDGQDFPAEVLLSRIDHVEQPLLQAVVRDISRRKAAEEARDQVLAILDATPDFVAASRPDGTITYINRGGMTLLGVDAEGSRDWIPPCRNPGRPGRRPGSGSTRNGPGGA